MDSDTGRAFVAVSELLNIDEHELLEGLMNGYLKTVRQEIINVAQKYPAFEDRYPFVEHHEAEK